MSQMDEKALAEWIYFNINNYDLPPGNAIHVVDCDDLLKGKTLIDTAELKRLQRLLNPRQWTQREHDAWHQNIPDLMAAFDALRGEPTEGKGNE